MDLIDAQSRKTTKSTDQRVLTLTVVDQGASSLSNFALTVSVAHFSDAHQLGVFGLTITTLILLQGTARSVSSDCLLTRQESGLSLLAYEKSGYLFGLLTMIIASIGLLIASVFVAGNLVSLLVILAVTLPFIELQDYSRFIGIKRANPGYSIALDTAWVVLFIFGFLILDFEHELNIAWLLGTWAGAGAIVGITTIRAHVPRGNPLASIRIWLASERRVASGFAAQFLLTSSGAYGTIYFLAFLVSIDAVGLVKLAQLALGPALVATSGLQSALISIGTKKWSTSRRNSLRFFALAGGAIGLLTIAWTVIIYFLPVHLITKAFGPTWPKARPLVPYIGMGFALGSFASAANAGLRSLRATRETLRISVIIVPVTLVSCLWCAHIWGAIGYAIGSSISLASASVLGWILLIRTSRRMIRHPNNLSYPYGGTSS